MGEEEEEEEGATRDLLASRLPAQPVSKEKRNREEGTWCQVLCKPVVLPVLSCDGDF